MLRHLFSAALIVSLGVDTFEREKGLTVKGASGVPVRTLVHYVLQEASRVGPPK